MPRPPASAGARPSRHFAASSTKQKELESRSCESRKELAEIEPKIEDLRSSISQISDLLAGTDTEMESEANELAAAAAAVASARAEADAVSERLAETNHLSVAAMNERASIEVRQAEAVTRLKTSRKNASRN